MYKTAYSMLDTSDINELKKLKKELDKKEIYNEKPYTIFELKLLWESFSDSRCAGFLYVDKHSVNHFINWLQGVETYD